jgi:dihydrodipicolinate synthase/N-acetylneuraminate lyase
MPSLTRDEQERLMAAAKAVADKATLIMETLGGGRIERAAEFALALASMELPVLRRKIQEAGEKTNWGLG